MKSDDAYLKHIRDAIGYIRSFVGQRAKELLVDEPNELIRSAVVRQLEIVGEAARVLSEEQKQREPAIAWRDIADTRNKLIHEYFGVDYEQVLLIIQEDLEPLDAAVERLLEHNDN